MLPARHGYTTLTRNGHRQFAGVADGTPYLLGTPRSLY